MKTDPDLRGSARYVAAILRHYRVKSSQVAHRIGEYGKGFLNFLVWLPKVFPKLIPVYRRNRSQEKERIHENFLEEFEQRVKVVFINLDKRTDRREETERELEILGIETAQRFEAISSTNGSLGCAQSHLKVLSRHSFNQGGLLLVCEDDIEFDCSLSQLVGAIQEFVSHPELDVLCLGYRLRAPMLPISRLLAVANGIQTTLCYLVKDQARDKLVSAFQRSEDMLVNGINPIQASIDQQWKREQSSDLLFCVPRKQLVLHRVSFSDIAGRQKDYYLGPLK